MSFSFGGLIGGAVAAVTSNLLGGKQSAKYSKAAQDRDIAFQTEYQQNKHQWEVADLKAAGLNPILSANSAGGSVGSSSSGMAGNIDPLQHAKDLQLLDSQIALNESASAKNVADAQLAGEQSKTQENLRDLQNAQKSLYGAQSLTQLTNNAQAQALLHRDLQMNSYMDRHPEIYGALVGNKYGGTLGGVAEGAYGLLENLFSPPNSSKAIRGAGRRPAPSVPYKHNSAVSIPSDFSIYYDH